MTDAFTDTIILLLRLAGLVVCAGVMVACVCRIDLLEPGRHQRRWSLMYLALLALAGYVGLGLLVDLVPWYQAAAVGLGLLYLWATRGRWRTGPPPDTQLQLDFEEDRP